MPCSGRCGGSRNDQASHEKSVWRAVPDPDRTADPHQAAPRGLTPVRVDPATRADGRVGRTTEPRGCVHGRPRRGGTAVVDEPAPAGCVRHYPVVPKSECRVSTDRSASGLRQPLRDPARHALVAPDEQLGLPSLRTAELISTQRSMVSPRGWIGTTASLHAPHGAVSSTTGLCPRRGRLAAQPRGSVVLPTGPPPQVRVGMNAWAREEVLLTVAAACATSRGRRARATVT